MKRIESFIINTTLVLLLFPVIAEAQNYSFQVPKMDMLVTVKEDASVHVAYDITFKNNSGAHAIDIVDIGTFHKGYTLGNVKASVGGVPLTNVRPSTVVKPGFEVHLGSHAIPPGGEGTFHVEFDMPNMVFQDTTDKELASLEIQPTWFDPQCQRGQTDLRVAVQLPKSVHPDEVLYQKVKFHQKAKTDNGALVFWTWPATRLREGAHEVGLSFPKRDMKRVIEIGPFGLLLKWFKESEGARLTAGVILLVLFGFLFFRFTGGTGVSVFMVLLAGLVVVMFVSPGWHLALFPIMVVLFGINEWFLGRRRSKYMPPIAQVEGGGIKRGLTSPEAAVLLELPISKVLSLVIFGMLKKGILSQLQADPLVVEVNEVFRLSDPGLSAKEHSKQYREAGRKSGAALHKYEHAFLFLLQNNPGKPVKEVNFSVPIKKLIERVVARMKGFDVSDTQGYYRAITRRACKQASAIGDIPQREKTIDRNFEWILMDDHYPTVFTYGRPYRPIWTRGSIGSGIPGGSSGPSMPAPSGLDGQTSFSDVGASFSGWAENTMGNMASAVSPGSLSVAKPSGGFLNLGGADKITGEFFQALGEAAASGGGGGGGGGCACACAGCACACACAGGGR